MTTITEKQKCIAEQAIYGNLMLNRRAYDDVEERYIIEQVDSKWVLDFINYDKLLSLTPILRPMSDLTKEITHKGYNDDKPFIPLVELIPHFDKSMYEDDLNNGIEPYLALEYATYTGHYFNIIDLLHKLHFDTRGLIEEGAAVDVNSLPHNPYEV